MPASSTPSPAEENPSFESAMERLEVIVGEMENARLPLEDLIRSYEEGTRLVAVCTERLTAAEQRIEIITRDAAGARRNVEVTATTIAGEAIAAGDTAPPPRSSTEVRAKPDAASSLNHQTSPPRVAKNRNEVSLF